MGAKILPLKRLRVLKLEITSKSTLYLFISFFPLPIEDLLAAISEGFSKKPSENETQNT